jgi:hypothetical protein
MKPKLNHLLSLWISFMFLLVFSPIKAEVKITEGKQTVSLSNQFVKLEYNLASGTYQIFNNSNGQIIIRDAIYLIADIYGESRSSDKGYIHSWISEEVKDEIGSGKKIIVTSSNKTVPGLLWEATIYEGKTFIILNAGVDNKMSFAIHLRQMHPIKSLAFKGYDIENSWATLDGNAGEPETKVRKDNHLKCWNNLLATFGSGKDRHSLVIGGLTYHEFEKWAELNKTSEGLEIDVWSEDPVGKMLDPGTRYFPDEKYYIDVLTPDPFKALEQYGLALKSAQKIELGVYSFPTLCLWYSGVPEYGGGEQNNTSVGAVKEMGYAKESGFLKYSKVAIRLVPDNYETINSQGWWDDLHWQTVQSGIGGIGPIYRPPYETTEKWGQAVTQLGGIPIMYSQTARRSEDYCYEHPEHMLFNDPNRRLKTETKGDKFFWDHGNPPLVGYDFTDPGFIKHMQEVYANLNSGGVRGLMFDYPDNGWFPDGGFEDKYSTTASAYRNIFKLPHDGLQKPNYVHERNLARGSDVTLGLVASQRTINDVDKMYPPLISRTGLRWYKNRVVVNYDTDAKNPNHILPENNDGRRAMYSMCYVASGRFLLGVSFSKLTKEQLNDLSRIFPFHSTSQSARPIDAFTGVKYPQVYDFKVNDKWHQLTLYNTKVIGGEWPVDFRDVNKGFKGTLVESTFQVELGQENIDGGLALDPGSEYYIYDFWNDCFIGKLKGDGKLEQTLRPGEVRMMSVHQAEPNPQFISTNRHIMQGYVDMSRYPDWDTGKKELSGISKVVGGETYKVVIALNGFKPAKIITDKPCKTAVKVIDEKNGLAVLSIDNEQNDDIEWRVSFKKQ